MSVPTEQSSHPSLSESPQISGFVSLGSVASKIPSLSSSVSPVSHKPSPSVSVPSFNGKLSDNGPKLSVPTEQSSHPSPSESPQISGFVSLGSVASKIPSLSSSVSPVSHNPSPSVSVPSFNGKLSDNGPKLSVPTEQSSHPSLSESPQISGFVSLGSVASKIPSLSSSVSPVSHNPSPSVSVPSFNGKLSDNGPKLSVPTEQSSHPSPSESPQISGFVSLGSVTSKIPSLSSSVSPVSHKPSPSVSVPSFNGKLSDNGPKLSVPTEQSSHPSLSESPQISGFVSLGSVASKIPSLSSSVSPVSHKPSPSVSVPSFNGKLSDNGPKLSVPTEQSSHPSPSESPQISGLVSLGSVASKIPSLSSSVSPVSHKPSPSVSVPSFNGKLSDNGPKLSVPTEQSSHPSLSESPQISGLVSLGSVASKIPSLSSSVSPVSHNPSPSVSVPSFNGKLSDNGPKLSVPTEQSSHPSLSESPQISGFVSLGSVASKIPSLSSSVSPVSHKPSPSVSVPSFNGKLSDNGPKLSVPTEQSSHPSLSESPQISGFVSLGSVTSKIPSLSSSVSPVSHNPSPSVSVPSFNGKLSDNGPKLSVPTEQSSHPSLSESPQISGFVSLGSVASKIPSLSSSVSPVSHKPSPSVSVPSFNGKLSDNGPKLSVPTEQSSHPSPSESPQISGFVSLGSVASKIPSLSSSVSPVSHKPSPSVSVPSFNGKLSDNGPKLSVPTEQSSHPSPSESPQISGFVSLGSVTSKIPSLSSSVSPVSHNPSPSVSVPSFNGKLSDNGPKLSVPTEQSSHPSPSESPQISGFVSLGSVTSKIPSLSSSVSPVSHNPSPSVSVPSFNGKLSDNGRSCLFLLNSHHIRHYLSHHKYLGSYR